MINEKILNLPLLMYKGKMCIKWNSKISGIYAWINEIDGKMYIGQTVNFYKRIYDEMNGFRNGRNQNMFKLFNAIQKYGIDNFRVIRLLECPKEYLNQIEKWLIKYYNTMKIGYNLTTGGDGAGGHIVTKEQIEKHKKWSKQYWTKENCSKQSEKMKMWFNSKPKDEQDKIKSGNNWWLNKEYKEKHLKNTRNSSTPEKIEKQRTSLIKYYENNDSKKAIVMDVISPNNETIKICGLDIFCKKYHLRRKGIVDILNKKKLYHKGWHLPRTPCFVPSVERIRGPDKVIYTFTSITKFCKEKNIDKGNLRKVMNGVCNSCKGYTKI